MAPTYTILAEGMFDFAVMCPVRVPLIGSRYIIQDQFRERTGWKAVVVAVKAGLVEQDEYYEYLECILVPKLASNFVHICQEESKTSPFACLLANYY